MASLLLAPRIHQRIAWPAIKPGYGLMAKWIALAGPAGRQDAQVRHTANIEYCHAFIQRTKHLLMKCSHQRCTLAACCKVAAAKVSHHGHAG